MFLVLIGTLNWSLSAQAQPATNGPPVVEPETVVIVQSAPKGWLKFGFDRLAALRYAPVADIPLWQELSSLIYVFLAFDVSKVLDALSSRPA